MSEEEKKPAEDKKLHPQYKPAEEDDFLIVRFVGNTAQIGHVEMQSVDPFQVLATAEWLKHQAKKMLLMQEQQIMQAQLEAKQKNKIAVAKGEIFDPNKRPDLSA